MLNLAKPVQMKNGTPVELLCTDLSGDFPLLGVFRVGKQKQNETWKLNGTFYKNSEHPKSLENAPEEKTVWINFYPSNFDCCAHDSIEAAKANQDENIIARKKVTYLVGQFDEQKT